MATTRPRAKRVASCHIDSSSAPARKRFCPAAAAASAVTLDVEFVALVRRWLRAPLQRVADLSPFYIWLTQPRRRALVPQFLDS